MWVRFPPGTVQLNPWQIRSTKIKTAVAMKTRARQDFKTNSLAHLPNDRCYLVGVSGGRDSVALLHWLSAHGYRNLVVCHFEHGLRGRAGKADALFVRRLTQKSGLEFETGHANIRALAKESKQSIETMARAQRLAF